MKRISRDKVHAAGVIAGGGLLLLGILAVLTEGGPPAQPAWTPEIALLQPNLPDATRVRTSDTEDSRRGARRVADTDPREDEASEASSPADARAAAERARALAAAEAEAREAEAPPPTGVVVGQVLDPAGQPVANAAVELRERRRNGQTYSATTDALGRFRLEARARRYRAAWAEAPGFAASERTDARVQADAETELTLVLRAACRLVGQVLDAGGVPVAGAQIQARGEDVREEARTDAEGRFAIESVAEGLYRVSAAADGYVEAQARDVPVSEQHGGELQLTLERAGRLEGLVRLAGQPLAERARVFIYRGDQRLEAVRTEADGSYAVEGLDPGPVEVFARSEDYAHTCRVSGAIEPGAPARIDLLLEEGARIVGVVRDPSGEPLPEIEVRAHSVDGDVQREGRTDAEGRYLIKHLYPGDYRLFVPQEGRRELEPRIEETLRVGAGEHARDLVLPVGAVFAGTVVDPAGQPVPDAWVFAIVGETYRGRTRTDDDGRFRLESLSADDYRIFVRVENDRLVSVTALRLNTDQVLTDQRVVARPPSRLRGRVLDNTGQPLADVQVRAQARENPVRREGRTGADGAFDLGPLYDGDYTLTVDDGSLALVARRRGADSASAPTLGFSVREQQDARLDVILQLQEPGLSQ